MEDRGPKGYDPEGLHLLGAPPTSPTRDAHPRGGRKGTKGAWSVVGMSLAFLLAALAVVLALLCATLVSATLSSASALRQTTAAPAASGAHAQDPVPPKTAVAQAPTVAAVVPDPAATATADPTATVQPDPAATERPDPAATATADPAATVQPDPSATVTADPDSTVTPDPAATVTADPAATVTPDPAATQDPLAEAAAAEALAAAAAVSTAGTAQGTVSSAAPVDGAVPGPDDPLYVPPGGGVQTAPEIPEGTATGPWRPGSLEVYQRNEETYERNIRERDAAVGDLSRDLSTASVREWLLVPTYSCAVDERFGRWGEGGKWVCLSVRKGSNPPRVISIGSNGETSFEKAMHDRLNATPDVFDFSLTDQLREAMGAYDFLRFHNAGLVGSAARAKYGSLRMYTVPQIMRVLNQSYVDVFKVDCESCEREVVRDLVRVYTRETVPFGQIQMEIHDVEDGPGGAIHDVKDMLLSLEELGYRMFHVELNSRYLQGFEAAFIHESLVKP